MSLPILEQSHCEIFERTLFHLYIFLFFIEKLSSKKIDLIYNLHMEFSETIHGIRRKAKKTHMPKFRSIPLPIEKSL